MPRPAVARWLPRATLSGLILATLFFAASLTPSLVPRGTLVQGVLSGISLAAGYGLGVAAGMLWRALQLPAPRGRWRRRTWMALGVLCLLGAGWSLSLASEWQNGLRALMGMPPVENLRPLGILALSVAVFLVLLWLARGLVLMSRFLSGRLERVLPGPQAAVLGIAATALIVWNVANGLIVRGAMTVLDQSYAGYDALFEESSPRPGDPLKSGGPGSLLDWEGLGRAGREMIAAGPDRAAIEAAAGAPALEPLRVYVGLNSAPDPQARADLALAELIRIGGFDRATWSSRRPPAPAGSIPKASARSNSSCAATWRRCRCNIPIWPAGSRCSRIPTTAWKPRAPSSRPSMDTGAACRPESGRACTCTG